MIREQAGQFTALFEDSGFQNVTLASLADYRTFGDESRDGKAVPTNRAFRGGALAFEFTVVVDRAPSDACEVSHAGRLASSTALFDTAFAALDDAVQRLGGVEAILAEPEIPASLRATIQARPETPWECAAGATFVLWGAGYPSVRYELVGENPGLPDQARS
jgi:hypothetical protein